MSELHAVPKPKARVKVRKRLRSHPGAKAFPHRRVPEYGEFIRGFACLLSGQDCVGGGARVGRADEAAHVKSRGAGGDDVGNEVPLCRGHHQELHQIGTRSFERKYQLDLALIAAELGRQYRARVQATEDP